MTYRIIEGDALERLADLDVGSVQTCITSPPYWGLRDYGTASWEGGDSECDHKETVARHDGGRAGVDGFNGSRAADSDKGGMNYRDTCGKCGATRIDSQLGLEPTPEQYVENLVAVFREVRRVLRDDGTLWLNLGDSYAGGPAASGGVQRLGPNGNLNNQRNDVQVAKVGLGLKPKDLVGIPWMVAFALRADGWYLRSDIIWAKPNPMPESVTDRPTKAHEYLFLLTKSARYFYDADAIREEPTDNPGGAAFYRNKGEQMPDWEPRTAEAKEVGGFNGNSGLLNVTNPGRNKRSVWTVATQPYAEAHFATFPPKLIEPCVLAGSPPKCCGECGAPWERVVERAASNLPRGERSWSQGAALGQPQRDGLGPPGNGLDVQPTKTLGWRPTCNHDNDSGHALVLDPFCGAGTTGLVALRHDRDFIGIELNPDYAQMARNRIHDDAPLLNVEAS